MKKKNVFPFNFSFISSSNFYGFHFSFFQSLLLFPSNFSTSFILSTAYFLLLSFLWTVLFFPFLYFSSFHSLILYFLYYLSFVSAFFIFFHIFFSFSFYYFIFTLFHLFSSAYIALFHFIFHSFFFFDFPFRYLHFHFSLSFFSFSGFFHSYFYPFSLSFLINFLYLAYLFPWFCYLKSLLVKSAGWLIDYFYILIYQNFLNFVVPSHTSPSFLSTKFLPFLFFFCVSWGFSVRFLTWGLLIQIYILISRCLVWNLQLYIVSLLIIRPRGDWPTFRGSSRER